MGDFEAHGRAVPAGDELALQRVHQVVDFFLVDVQVAVARDAELVAALDLHADEQFRHEGMDDGRQENEIAAAGVRAGRGSA